MATSVEINSRYPDRQLICYFHVLTKRCNLDSIKDVVLKSERPPSKSRWKNRCGDRFGINLTDLNVESHTDSYFGLIYIALDGTELRASPDS